MNLRTRKSDASTRIRIRDRIRAAGGAVSTYVVDEADALQELLDDGLVEQLGEFWCVAEAEVDVTKIHEIVEVINRSPGLTATEIAARLGFEAGPTSAHLCSARKAGHVRSEPCTQSAKRPMPLRWYPAALAASEAVEATTDTPEPTDAPTSATEREAGITLSLLGNGPVATTQTIEAIWATTPSAPPALDSAAVLAYLRERIVAEDRLEAEARDAEMAARDARNRYARRAAALRLALEAIEEAEDADG